MRVHPCTAIISRVRYAIRDFAEDRRGLAALEFAMVLPLMIAFFFGMIEVTNGFTVDRKVTVVARTLSDLTSRMQKVDLTQVNNFFTVGNAIMQPFSSTPLNATITELYIDPSTSVGRVQWSRKSSGIEGRKAGTTMTVPVGLIAKDKDGKTLANQYLILSEVDYLYTPAIGYFMNKAGITLSDSTFTRPRQVDCVFYPNQQTGAKCPTT